MQIETLCVGGFGANCYLVSSAAQNAVVIDPGDDAPDILSAIEKLGVIPKYIFLTHGHFDHTGAVNALKKRYPDLMIVVGEKDTAMLADLRLSLGGNTQAAREKYLITPQRTVQDGDEIALDELQFIFYETPGHTPGSVVIRCGNTLFTGDTIFAGSIGRTDFPGGNYSAIKRSLARIARLPGDYDLLPGHGERSTLEYERKTNPYFGNVSYDDYSF